MKKTLLIPVLGFLLFSCDSMLGLDKSDFDELLEYTKNESVNTNGIHVRIRCSPPSTIEGSGILYVVNDSIVPTRFTDKKSTLRSLEPEYITYIKILKDEEAELWLKGQHIFPRTEYKGIVFIKTDQENWGEGFDLQRVKNADQ